jgi:hypothetical protein
MQIKYITGNEMLLEDISTLWNELNMHHVAKSVYFKEYFLQLDFETRIKKILC